MFAVEVPDQNLVLLDEATVYNAAHLFGFFSVFNVDAIKSVNLIKGGMPARFGGRMSSVLEVAMNERKQQRIQSQRRFRRNFFTCNIGRPHQKGQRFLHRIWS